MEAELLMTLSTNGMKRHRSIEESANLINLPDPILDDILARLPAKSISTCIRVCKHLHSRITHPDFHCKTDAEFIFIFEKPHAFTFHLKLYSIREDGSVSYMRSCYAVTHNDFKYNGEDIVVSNSCNGFVVIVIGHIFFLFNPSIRRHFVKELECSQQDSIVVAGICYDESIDDCKVVIQYKNSLGRGFVAVASLKTKQWSQINFPFDIESIKTGPIVKGKMHWTVDDKSKIRSKKIIHFDASKNSFKELPSPRSDFRGGNAIISLGIIGECLCMARKDNMSSIEVLIMKEYGIGESWTTLGLIPSCFQPFRFRKNGEFLHWRDRAIVSYNLQEKKWERMFGWLSVEEFSNSVLIGRNFASPVAYKLDDTPIYSRNYCSYIRC